MYRPSDDGATWRGADEPMLLKTIPLDFHKLIVFSPEITWGFLIIDELNQRADRQQWQSGGQPLLMERLVQLGKSHLSMTATVQSLQWVNPRYMFQTDMSTACRDAFMTAWGKANGLLPGDLTFLYSKDLSGGSTGYMYEESGTVHETQFHGKWIQKFYKTDDIQDPWEHYESIKIKRQTYEVDPNAKQEIDSYPQDIAILDQVMFEHLKEDNLKPERAAFLKTCQQMGMNMDKSEAIAYIVDCYDVKKYTSNGIVKLDLTRAKDSVVKKDFMDKQGGVKNE
jgi:hypothetical protein